MEENIISMESKMNFQVDGWYVTMKFPKESQNEKAVDTVQNTMKNAYIGFLTK